MARRTRDLQNAEILVREKKLAALKAEMTLVELDIDTAMEAQIVVEKELTCYRKGLAEAMEAYNAHLGSDDVEYTSDVEISSVGAEED